MAEFTRANPHLEEIIADLAQHLERNRGDVARAAENLSKADSDWIDQELGHVITDTRYFLSNYYAIKTEDKGFQGLYPFWDSQEILHDEFRAQERLKGKVRAMINKARQMGSTTYVGGEIFHKTIFSEHVNTIVVAQDADQSRFILDMYGDAIDFLPWWMRPRIRYKEAGKFMDFDEKDDQLRETRPGLKTRIYVDNGNKPTGSGRGKCQVPWTQIWTTAGPTSLEDLFSSTCLPGSGTVDIDGIGEWFTPQKPVFTWAFNGERLEQKRVTKVFRQMYRGPIQKIQVANGVTIEKTPEHRLLASRKWVSEVVAGEHIDCAHELPWAGTSKPTPEFAELLAWQIAEGCEGQYNTCFITQKEDAVRDRIASLVLATTGRVPVNKRSEELAGPNKAGYVLISGKEYKRFVTSQGYEWGRRSATKKIPSFVFDWDKASVAIFLRAFFEAEGSVSDKVDIISASKQVMESLRILCAAFGISLRVRPCIKYASNTERKVRRTYYRGYISGPSMLRFHERVGFLSERKQDKLTSLVLNSNGYTLQQCPRITQMFRDACLESRTPSKKILGTGRRATNESMSLKVAREALGRMDSIVERLPMEHYGKVVHYAYKNCDQKKLGEWADRIRVEVESDLCEEKVVAVSDYDYDGYIYDLEVEDTHNYLTAGVVTHNTFRRAHLSELSFWSNPTQLTKSLFPTMNAPDGFYVMESTPNGRNDAWHKLWKKAESGSIDWHPIYIPFYRREKTYSLPIPKGTTFILTEEEADVRSQVLKKEGYFVKDEVLNWRRRKIEEFTAVDDDAKMFSQEYSSNAEESFQTSAVTAYPLGLLNRLQRKTMEPLWVGDVWYDFDKRAPQLRLRQLAPKEQVGRPERENCLHMWEMPIAGERYVVGADVSLGNEGGDFSCIQVIKLTSGVDKDEQVAVWHGYIDPESLADPVLALGWLYNEALVAIEVNNMGMVTNNELVRRMEYENVYRFKRMDRLKNFVTDIVGFWSDDKSTRNLMAKMSKTLKDDLLIIRDRHTVDEFFDYTEDEGAKGDANDDYVDALQIALYCGHEGEFKEMRSPTNPVADKTKNLFEIKDRFNTIFATTSSQSDAERIAKKHIGSSIVRTAAATATVTLQGKKHKVPSDLQSTDWSPIHDGDGSAHRMYYEEGMDAEEIDRETIDAYESQLEEAENSENAWMYT